MPPSELLYRPATELRQLYRERAVSAVEVAETTLAWIEEANPRLNAFITVTRELALRQARAADKALASGTARLLEGVPVSIKDLTPTRGVRTTRGSLLTQDWIPDFDAVVVERVYAAGGVLIGKTNTPELGWKGDAGNRVVGPTHNPWRHGLTPGGSSGGAAAAVAAGMGPLAHGTDGAGSIRSPAAYCGVVGFKPSFGLVPSFPPSPVEVLAHAGPITRTVRDAAVFLDALAGPDGRDPNSLGQPDVDYLGSTDGLAAGVRVAWSPRLWGGAPLDPEIERVTADAAAVFSELGCEVEQVETRFGDPCEIVETLWTSALGALHVDDLEQVRDLIDPGRLELVEAGLRLSGADVAGAYIRRAAFREEVRAFMERYDALLTPTMPCMPFPAGDDRPGELDGKPTTNFSWTPFTYPFNVTGQPAASVPCGFTSDGLPVGLQIVGRLRDDVGVLKLAAGFEEARPWAESYPPTDIQA
jgi:aspartyl-tRNA(Asn)/glutamyl-tRNA(Gln) amidotransferase subunit A